MLSLDEIGHISYDKEESLIPKEVAWLYTSKTRM
jgi:hypothetical protein